MLEERKEKFTPGPWYIKNFLSSITIHDGKKMVCRCIQNEQGMKYARLIAAAPEMYALLDKCESAIRHWLSGSIDEPMIGETENTINEVQKLLAKARGEEVKDD